MTTRGRIIPAAQFKVSIHTDIEWEKQIWVKMESHPEMETSARVVEVNLETSFSNVVAKTWEFRHEYLGLTHTGTATITPPNPFDPPAEISRGCYTSTLRNSFRLVAAHFALSASIDRSEGQFLWPSND